MDPRPIFIAVGGIEHDKAPAYLAALAATGVAPERVRVLVPEAGENYAELVTQAAGLVLAGGDDLEPQLYGEAVLPEAVVETTPERDAMEVALLTGARTARTPVWAICRGLQMVNVFHGGSLYQDLTLQRPSAVPHSIPEPQDALAHGVSVVAPGHRLGVLLAGEDTRVNSRHHQGIKDLGKHLLPIAASLDGLVEAIAGDSPEWWVRAVQWHPENLLAFESQRSLWQDFVAATEAPR